MSVMIRTYTKANSQNMENRGLRKERRKGGEDGGRGGERKGGNERVKGEPVKEGMGRELNRKGAREGVVT